MVLDLKHKIYSEPLTYSDTEFRCINCQYANISNLVKFQRCRFSGDVIWGDEINNEAYSRIESDMIFEDCVFFGKVFLDGIKCKGRISFIRCTFLYESQNNSDYALNLSNGVISLGIEMSYCHFKGGINLSGTNIKQVGCFFNHVTIDNINCSLCFNSTYLAKELCFISCNIICNSINLESTSLHEQGHIIFRGQFMYADTIENLLFSIFKEQLLGHKLIKVASLYEEKRGDDSHLAVLSVTGAPQPSIFFKDILSFKTAKYIDHVAESTGNSLIPIGELFLAELDDDLTAVITYCKRTAYITIYGKDFDYIESSYKKEIQDYAGYIFKDQQILAESLETGYHVGMTTISCKSTQGINLIAVQADNGMSQEFKVYEWNYFKLGLALSFPLSNIGNSFIIEQTEIKAPCIQMNDIFTKNFKCQDLKLETTIWDLTCAKCDKMILNNIDIRTCDYPENVYFNSTSPACLRGINLSKSDIVCSLEICDVIFHNKLDSCLDSCLKPIPYGIDLSFAKISKDIVLNNVIYKYNYTAGYKYPLLNINLVHLNCLRFSYTSNPYYKALFNVDDFEVTQFILNGYIPNVREIKNLNFETPPCQLLKSLETYHFVHGSKTEAEQCWRYRNKLRIKRDHKKNFLSRFLHLFWNKYVVDYGLHTYPLVIILITFMVGFSLLINRVFGVPFWQSIMNSLVTVIPVSFNEEVLSTIEPILHSDASEVQRLLYSISIIVYRVISYILLAVLIASFGNFFKKVND